MLIKEKEGGFIFQILKGVTIALLTTLISVLIFAFILSVTNLSDKAIKPINQIVKLTSVFLGCIFAVRGQGFLVKGGLIGLFSAIFSILIFAVLGGGVFSWITTIIDVIFSTLFGFVSGIFVYKLS